MRLQLKYLLTFLLFLIYLGSLGQSRIGLVAGLNSGKFSGDSPPGGKYVSGIDLSFGIEFDYQLKEDVFITTAPAFVTSQSKIQFPKISEENGELIETYEDSIALDFQIITLPLKLKLISDNKKWQFGGGFELAFPVKLNASNTENEEDLIDQINQTNINMLFSIGYRIPINRQLLTIDLTYSQGLTNLANNLDDPNSTLPRVRFTYFLLSVTWSLPVGKDRFSQPASN